MSDDYDEEKVIDDEKKLACLKFGTTIKNLKGAIIVNRELNNLYNNVYRLNKLLMFITL